MNEQIKLWNSDPNVYFRVAHKSEDTFNFQSQGLFGLYEGVFAASSWAWMLHFGDYFVENGTNNPDDYNILVIEGIYVGCPDNNQPDETIIKPIRILDRLDVKLVDPR